MTPSTAPPTAAGPGTDPASDAIAPQPAEPVLVEADLLVEDVSIDGMCGVY
jgi:mycofactocin precursor